jgi:hypothetical protein
VKGIDRRLPPAGFGHGDEVAVITDHDVIENPDADELANLPEAGVDGLTLGGGDRVAAWMVVDEDEGRGRSHLTRHGHQRACQQERDVTSTHEALLTILTNNGR